MLSLDEVSDIAFEYNLTPEEGMSMYISYLADKMTFEFAWRVALYVIALNEIIKIYREVTL